MPSFLIVSDTEDFRVLLAQLLAIEWPDVEVEDWELRSKDKTPTPWPRVDLVLLDCGASHSEPTSLIALQGAHRGDQVTWYESTDTASHVANE
jgi:hypothetical protein